MFKDSNFQLDGWSVSAYIWSRGRESNLYSAKFHSSAGMECCRIKIGFSFQKSFTLVFYISFGTIENSWIGYIFSFIKNQNIFRQLFKKNKKNTTRHNLNDTHERCLEQKDFCHFLIEKFLLFLNFSAFKIWEYSHL